MSLQAATLLYSTRPLVYGSGRGLGMGGGTPTLNRPGQRYFFTGQSGAFDPRQPSSSPDDGRLDPESLRVSPDGRSMFIGDDYGPRIYRFDQRSGEREQIYALPAALAVAHPQPSGHAEDHANRRGRVGNHGIEGLALTPDGRVLCAVLQGPLLQDGGKHGGYTRILRIELASGTVQQFAYPLSRLDGSDRKPHFGGVSDLLTIDDQSLLVDECDGRGLGSDAAAVCKQVFRVDLGRMRGHWASAKAARRWPLWRCAAAVPGHRGDIDPPRRARSRHSREAGSLQLRSGLELARPPAACPVCHRRQRFPRQRARLAASCRHDNPNRFYVFGSSTAELPVFTPPARVACAVASTTR